MIGTGYVGLVSGVCFADLGNEVICVDQNLDKINKLKKSIIPIYEPGLDELVKKNYNAGRLKFSTNLSESIEKSNIVFICVGTPTKKNKYERVIRIKKKVLSVLKMLLNKLTNGSNISKYPKIIAKVVKKPYMTKIIPTNIPNDD